MTSTPTAPPALPVWRQPEFAQGVRDMLPSSAGLAAWGLVTGVALIQGGMGWPLALAMSLFVFAGTAQLTTAPLIAAGAPLWVVWATALCVNLRFVIFSLNWRPYFVHLNWAQRLRAAYFTTDVNYVVFMQRYPRPEPGSAPMAYFWGGCITNWAAWHIASLAGMVVAGNLPASWGVGFAGTLTLVALSSFLLKGAGTWASTIVAGAASVAAYALPLKLHIVVAIAAAVAAGMLVDHSRAALNRQESP